MQRLGTQYWRLLSHFHPFLLVDVVCRFPIESHSAFRPLLILWIRPQCFRLYSQGFPAEWEAHLVQFSTGSQSCPTPCDPMDSSSPGHPVHHQLPESTQTHVHWVSDVIQPPHPPSSPSPHALNLSQHQGLFQWVNSSHKVAKVPEFQLQHQSFQWTPRTHLL